MRTKLHTNSDAITAIRNAPSATVSTITHCRAGVGLDRTRSGVELELEQPVVGTAGRDQLVVGALLHNLSHVKTQDAVGVANRREAVCNEDAGATLGEALRGRLDELFAGIDAARGLVEDEDAGLLGVGLTNAMSWRWPVLSITPAPSHRTPSRPAVGPRGSGRPQRRRPLPPARGDVGVVQRDVVLEGAGEKEHVWRTTPMEDRSWSSEIVRMSSPSMVIRPFWNS